MAAKKIKKVVKKSAKKNIPAKKAKIVKKVMKAKPKAKVKAKPVRNAKVSASSKASANSKAKAKLAVKKKVLAKRITKPSAKKAVIKAKSNSSKSMVVPKANFALKAKPAKLAVDLQSFVTPLDDRILVRVIAAEKVTAGGLFIPDTVTSVSGNQEGHIVSVGRGHLSKKGHVRPLDVKLGDKIVFAEYAGTKINVQNEVLIILRESDVMGVVAK